MGMFSNSLIQGLINPSFGDNLSQVGMLAGSYDRRRREKQEEDAKKALVAQRMSALMQDESPQRIRQGATELFQTNPEASKMLMDRAAEMSAKMAQLTGAPENKARAEQNAMRGRQAGLATDASGKKAWNEYLTSQGRTDLIGVDPKEAAAILKVDKETAGKRTLEGKNRYLSVGNSVLDMTNSTWVSPPTSSEVSSITPAQISALYEKNTPESVQSFLIDPMKNILVPLESSGGPTRGEVPSSVEKQFAAINEESGAASVSLNQNRNLQQTLLSDPSKATGILSDIRTFALDVAGLRDAEEETKTTYLRNRNTQIINNLPPGVASDRDISLFSQGFPSDNASAEEILRYLQVEEKMLAYSADMGLLADRHLQQQINPSNGQPGQKASMVGFIDKRTSYANVMKKAEALIVEARASNNLEKEQQLISQLSSVLGFTPKLYE
jgi:hypothetical protein